MHESEREREREREDMNKGKIAEKLEESWIKTKGKEDLGD